MTDDELKAMTFQRPRQIPVHVGILPAAWMRHRDKLQEIVDRHPSIFGPSRQRDYDAVWKQTYRAGEHVDAWGCVWRNVHDGREAIVTGHPLPRREDIRKLEMPTVDEGMPHGFMWLRLADLRGFEELMIDFAEEPPELQRLIDMVLEYNFRQLELRLASARPGELMSFGDDQGMQTALPISPAKWQKYLKPCYARLYGRCRQAGHPVYMHSDGHMLEIIADLVECGVNIINPQVRANGLDNLARVCKPLRVCVDLDLDRQLFPFATPAEIDAHVRQCVETLGSPEGGLWLKGEVDDGVPLENVEALCEAMERYRERFSIGHLV